MVASENFVTSSRREWSAQHMLVDVFHLRKENQSAPPGYLH
jgi:hypothetical protein